MLRSLKKLERYTVSATDGDIGTVADFFLDDEHWAVRYLVVETGSLFDRREVLISPAFFRRVEWAGRRFYLDLTKAKVRESPSAETDKPVSRQYEWRDSYHFAYPYGWSQSDLFGTGTYSSLFAAAKWSYASFDQATKPNDVHLRSASEVRGYHLQGSDENAGRVSDFIVDDEIWVVRYLLIDTSNWWFGRQVLVAPHCVHRISWGEGDVYVDLPREAVRNSPTWKPILGINREYEAKLNDQFDSLAVVSSVESAPRR